MLIVMVKSEMPWKELFGQFLKWVGIIGGAIELVHNWSGLIEIVERLRWLVEHFSTLMHMFWSSLLALADVKVSKSLSRLLSGLLFYISLAAGTIYVFGLRKFNIMSLLWIYLTALALISLSTLYLLFLKESVANNSVIFHISYTPIYYIDLLVLAVPVIACFLLLDASLKEKLYYSAVTSIVFGTTFVAFFKRSVDLMQQSNYYGAYVFEVSYLFYIIVTLLLVITPTKALMNNLSFMLMGAAILSGVNELLKLAEHFNELTKQIK